MKSNTENSIVTYFKGVRSEWSKITWPEKMQIQAETFVVLIIVLIFTVAIFLMDKFFQLVLGLIH